MTMFNFVKERGYLSGELVFVDLKGEYSNALFKQIVDFKNVIIEK